MRETVIVALCGLIAIVVVLSLIKARKTGRISSRGWTFQVDENPIGFWFVVFCDALILGGCLWFALYTLGAIGSLSVQLPSSR